MAMPANELAWMAAGGGYAIALDGARIVARSPKGALLKSMPASLKDAAAVQQLRELRDWLTRHERECASTVEAWMVRSLLVPTSVLSAVWPDPAWQAALRDAVLVPLGPDGESQRESAGFLRLVDADRGVGLVTLDGETIGPVWEGGHLVEARYWIGSDAPESEAVTGDLMWVVAGEAQQTVRTLRNVGPVAFSEGMRMAAAIYAGRVADNDGTDRA